MSLLTALLFARKEMEIHLLPQQMLRIVCTAIIKFTAGRRRVTARIPIRAAADRGVGVNTVAACYDPDGPDGGHNTTVAGIACERIAFESTISRSGRKNELPMPITGERTGSGPLELTVYPINIAAIRI